MARIKGGLNAKKKHKRVLKTHCAIAKNTSPEGTASPMQGCEPLCDGYVEGGSLGEATQHPPQKCINRFFLNKHEKFRRKINTFVNASAHEATMSSEDDGAEGRGDDILESVIDALFFGYLKLPQYRKTSQKQQQR